MGEVVMKTFEKYMSSVYRSLSDKEKAVQSMIDQWESVTGDSLFPSKHKEC